MLARDDTVVVWSTYTEAARGRAALPVSDGSLCDADGIPERYRFSRRLRLPMAVSTGDVRRTSGDWSPTVCSSSRLRKARSLVLVLVTETNLLLSALLLLNAYARVCGGTAVHTVRANGPETVFSVLFSREQTRP